MTTPNLGLRELTQNQAAPDVAHNEGLQVIDTLLQSYIISIIAVAPGAPNSGDAHIITGTPGAGADWEGAVEDDIAYYYVDAWYYLTPSEGWLIYLSSTNTYYKYDGANWAANSASPNFSDATFRIQDNGDATKELAFEVVAITTGTTKTITMPDANIDLTPGTGSFATAAEGDLAATALQDVSDDATPSLGGDLDVEANQIKTTTVNGDVVIVPDGTGVISVAGTTDYENNVTVDDDIPNKKYVDDLLYQDLGEVLFANLPAAASNANHYILVTDADPGGNTRTICRSDGTNWKILVTEGATVTKA